MVFKKPDRLLELCHQVVVQCVELLQAIEGQVSNLASSLANKNYQT